VIGRTAIATKTGQSAGSGLRSDRLIARIVRSSLKKGAHRPNRISKVFETDRPSYYDCSTDRLSAGLQGRSSSLIVGHPHFRSLDRTAADLIVAWMAEGDQC